MILTVSVEIDKSDHHEKRMPVELVARIRGPGEPSPVVSHPYPGQNDRDEPGNLSKTKVFESTLNTTLPSILTSAMTKTGVKPVVSCSISSMFVRGLIRRKRHTRSNNHRTLCDPIWTYGQKRRSIMSFECESMCPFLFPSFSFSHGLWKGTGATAFWAGFCSKRENGVARENGWA